MARPATRPDERLDPEPDPKPDPSGGAGLTTEFSCPVCKEGFGNEGALAAHLALTKDAAHHAHRSGANLLPAPKDPSPPAQPDGSGPLSGSGSGGSNPPVSPVGEAHPTRPADQPEPTPDPNPGPEIVTFERPFSVGPLLPDPGSSGTGSGPDAGKTPPKVEISLEPFIDQSVSALANGFFLAEKTDDKLRPEEVHASGFSKAADACLSHYLPQLPKDHPLTALVVSGATLAFIIAQKKSALKPDPTRPAATQPDPTHPPAKNPDPKPDQPGPARPDGSTGDAYWDAILRGAQGGPRLDDD